MKIQVLRNFGGTVTGERRIAPGIYDSTDAQLSKAIISEMLHTGHAVLIESTDTPAPDTLPQAVDSTPDYPSYTRAELMELLDDEGIAYSNRDNKDTLLALLTGDDS